MHAPIAKKWTIVIVTTAVLLGLLLLSPQVAKAGSYVSLQCPANWTFGAPDAQVRGSDTSYATWNTCDDPTPPSGGRALRMWLGQETCCGGWREWAFDGPDWVHISRVQTWANLSTNNNNLVTPQLYMETQGGNFTIAQGDAPYWGWYDTGPGWNGTAFGAAMFCVGWPCNDWTAGLAIRETFLELTDIAAPNMPGVSGALVATNWVRQSRNVTIDAADAGSGMASVAVSANGQAVVSRDVCEEEYVPGTGFTRRLKPCGTTASPTLAVDTTQAPFHNGSNNVYLCASDFATITSPHTTCAQRTVNVDNVPPEAPGNLTVAGGTDWRATNDFDVSWANPPHDGFSPANGAVYELVNQQGQVVEGRHRSREALSRRSPTSTFPTRGNTRCGYALGMRRGTRGRPHRRSCDSIRRHHRNRPLT